MIRTQRLQTLGWTKTQTSRCRSTRVRTRIKRLTLVKTQTNRRLMSAKAKWNVLLEIREVRFAPKNAKSTRAMFVHKVARRTLIAHQTWIVQRYYDDTGSASPPAKRTKTAIPTRHWVVIWATANSPQPEAEPLWHNKDAPHSWSCVMELG